MGAPPLQGWGRDGFPPEDNRAPTAKAMGHPILFALSTFDMKLAFSTNAYTQHSLTTALRGIKEAGFAGVEILADTPHAYPDAIDAALTDNTKRELDKLELAVSNVNVNCSFGYWKDAPPEPYFEPSLISPNAKHREDRTRLILQALQFAKDVGAANVSITSGRMLGGMPPEPAAKQFAVS